MLFSFRRERLTQMIFEKSELACFTFHKILVKINHGSIPFHIRLVVVGRLVQLRH